MGVEVLVDQFQRWRFRCPYCESVSITRRITTSDFRCNRCGQVFKEPLDTSG